MHKHDGIFAIIIGFITGIWKWWHTMKFADDFPQHLIEAFITAIICTVGGLIGKWLAFTLRLAYKDIVIYFKNKKK